MAGGGSGWENVRNLLIKEQFLKSCPKDLQIHLKELDPKLLDALTSNADQYLSAHKKNLCSKKVQENDGGRSSNEHQRRARKRQAHGLMSKDRCVNVFFADVQGT